MAKNGMSMNKIINWVLYGNPDGHLIINNGVVSHEYDEFLNEVFNYKKERYEKDTDN